LNEEGGGDEDEGKRLAAPWESVGVVEREERECCQPLRTRVGARRRRDSFCIAPLYTASASTHCAAVGAVTRRVLVVLLATPPSLAPPSPSTPAAALLDDEVEEDSSPLASSTRQPPTHALSRLSSRPRHAEGSSI
jgi:hypothetical protein